MGRQLLATLLPLNDWAKEWAKTLATALRSVGRGSVGRKRF